MHTSGYCTFTNVGKPLPIYTLYIHMAYTDPTYMLEVTEMMHMTKDTCTVAQADESGYNHPLTLSLSSYPGADCMCVMLHQKYPIIQSEVSQKEKHQYSILTHIYGI